MRKDLLRRAASFFLAGTLMATSVLPVFAEAADTALAGMGSESEYTAEVPETNPAPAPQEDVLAGAETQNNVSEKKDEGGSVEEKDYSDTYMLILPKVNYATYDYEESHYAGDISNDQFNVLLYDVGETVNVSIVPAENYTFKIVDADTGAEFITTAAQSAVEQAAGKSEGSDKTAEELTQNANEQLSFAMPAQDLMAAFTKATNVEPSVDADTEDYGDAEIEDASVPQEEGQASEDNEELDLTEETEAEPAGEETAEAEEEHQEAEVETEAQETEKTDLEEDENGPQELTAESGNVGITVRKADGSSFEKDDTVSLLVDEQMEETSYNNAKSSADDLVSLLNSDEETEEEHNAETEEAADSKEKTTAKDYVLSISVTDKDGSIINNDLEYSIRIADMEYAAMVNNGSVNVLHVVDGSANIAQGVTKSAGDGAAYFTLAGTGNDTYVISASVTDAMISNMEILDVSADDKDAGETANNAASKAHMDVADSNWGVNHLKYGNTMAYTAGRTVDITTPEGKKSKLSAFCSQPSLAGPSEGTWKTSDGDLVEITNTEVGRAMYFLATGPGFNLKLPALGNKSMNEYFESKGLTSGGHKKYITHMVIGYINGGSKWNYNGPNYSNVLTDSGVALVKDIEGKLNIIYSTFASNNGGRAFAPGAGSNATLNTASVSSAMKGDSRVSGEISYIAVKENAATVSASGCKIVCSNGTSGNNSLRIPGGTSFHLENITASTVGNKAYTVTPSIGTSYRAYKLKTKGKQDLVTCYYSANSLSFSVNWVPIDKPLEIYKTIGGSTKNGLAEFSLEGAQYGIYTSEANANSKTNAVETLTTDANGYAKSEKKYTVGNTVYVREILAPPSGAYEIDDTVYPVKIEAAGASQVINHEEPLKYVPFNYTKTLMGDHITASQWTALDGVTFYFTYVNENSAVDDFKIAVTVQTDNYNPEDPHKVDLHITTTGNEKLVPGTWIMKESDDSVPEGFTPITYTLYLAPDGTATLTEEDGTEINPNDGVNRQLKHNLFIKKIDADSGNVVTGSSASFKIVDDDGEEMTLDQLGVGETNVFKTIDGEISLRNVPGGTYKLVEVEAPEGYKLTSNEDLVLTAETINEQGWTFTAKDDTEHGIIEVTKIDEKTKEHCGAGFVFEVVCAEDIVDGSGAVRKDPDTGKELKAEEVADTITTEDDGIATSKELYLGKYYVREKQSGEYYSINEEKYPVEVKEGDSDGEVLVFPLDIENPETLLTLEKFDTVTGKPVPGVTFSIYEKGSSADAGMKVTTGADGIAKVSWTIQQNEAFLKHNTTYCVEEVEPAPGYPKNDKVYTFEVDSQGLVQKGNDGSLGKLDGNITIVIRDDDLYNNGTAQYAPSQPTTFRTYEDDEATQASPYSGGSVPEGIGETGEWQSETADLYIPSEFNEEKGNEIKLQIPNTPTPTAITKSNITNGKPVIGAELTVTRKDSGDVIDTWVTTEKPHMIYGLPDGTYVLTEKTVVDGYEMEEAVDFEIKASKVVHMVNMADSPERPVEISKKDITNGEELPGATLQICDQNGNVIFEWVSTEEEHKVTLPSGNYQLIERKPADGYVTAEKIDFTIVKTSATDYEVHGLKMEDDVTKIEISKQDITNSKEIPGATIVIFDKDGTELHRWVSTDTPHYIEKLPIGTYTLREITAPNGYEVAEDVIFTVQDTGEIQHVLMYDSPYRDIEISKTDITNGKEIEGAKLEVVDADKNVVESWMSTKEPHKFKIHSGTYTLIERIPADGYVTANPIVFTVKKTTNKDYEVQHVEMVDDITKVQITKTDLVSGKILPGAKLVIKDSSDKVVETWISTNKPHYIERLPIGKYTLTEITAPNGYEVAETVKFEITDSGVVHKVTMKDAPKSYQAPKTGDFFRYWPALVCVLAGVVLILAVVFTRKKKSK